MNRRIALSISSLATAACSAMGQMSRPSYGVVVVGDTLRGSNVKYGVSAMNMNMKMNTPCRSQPSRRKLLNIAMVWPWVAGCNASAGVDPQRRFRGVGVVLVVDAVPGAQLEGVVFYDDRAVTIYASSVVAKRNREIMGLGGKRVPLTVKVIWRDHPKPVWVTKGAGGIDYEGTIIGDYTVPVAERIPEDVLNSIRISGGALRLKFRLKQDGVLFGWDIERPGGGISKFDMPGGDFLDTRY